MRTVNAIFQEYKDLDKKNLSPEERSAIILYLMADLIHIATNKGLEKERAKAIIMEGTEKEFCSLRDEVSKAMNKNKET